MALNGYDISNHQRGLNVAKVPGDIVIAKATEGLNFVDRYCDGFVQAAFRAGKLVGVYHFASGKATGRAEAEFFVKNVKGYIGKAVLILDWEASAIKRGPGYAKDFLDTVFRLTGVRPMIYMSQSTCTAYNWAAVKAANYGLWVAAYYYGYKRIGYTPNCPIKGGLGAFGSAAMYQYTSSGRLPGYGGNLDLDVFYGDRAAWAKYAAKAGTKPAATPAPAQPAKPTAKAKGNAWVAAIQKECNRQGFSKQAIDGEPGPNTLAGCPTLRRGAKGGITKLMQQRLIALGFPCGRSGADGDFGTGTRNAVIAFQRAKSLTADGIVGKNTWRRLLGL